MRPIQRPDYVPVGRYCSNCNHKKEESAVAPGGQIYTRWTCGSEYCRDPVTGEQMPCNRSREQVVLCGVDGRYFEEKTEAAKAPIFELVTK